MRNLIIAYQMYMEVRFIIELNNVLKCRQLSKGCIKPKLLRNIIVGGHQHRLPYHKYVNFTKFKKNIKDALVKPKSIFSCSFGNFEELYDELEKRLIQSNGKKIKGIGQLTLYDMAVRIGYIMPSGPIMPHDYLYLQCGALKGYQNLQFYNPTLSLPLINKEGRYPISMFGGVFHGLTSMFIEDFLCVYHNDFASLSSLTISMIQKKLTFSGNVPIIK